jgi:hypothetical protein
MSNTVGDDSHDTTKGGGGGAREAIIEVDLGPPSPDRMSPGGMEDDNAALIPAGEENGDEEGFNR